MINLTLLDPMYLMMDPLPNIAKVFSYAARETTCQ